MVSVHSEGTFAPIPFRRRPPQSNSPSDIVPRPAYGRGLETQYRKGGIPTAAPHGLASLHPCLPPILYIQHRVPVSNWSKAPWGLSVLARVASIFTGTSVSPGALSRQRSNHYAFRAGRNLPDKEFRYLRTVIVTAAVYWGLDSKLRFLTPPLNLPAPGRRQPIYLTFRFRIDLLFLLNSCLGQPFHCGHPSMAPLFSRSYGAILPSSLTMLLPPALGFSPHPPVSVYGTGTV